MKKNWSTKLLCGQGGSIVLLCSLLVGCGTFTKQPIDTKMIYPDKWSAVQHVGEVKWNKQWWTVYGDEKLNNFVEEVFSKSPEMQIALSKVDQALYQSNLTNTNVLPNANGSVNTNISQDSNGTRKSNATSAGLNYEVDLWGKLALQRDMAAFALSATEEDKEATQLTLAATAVTLYFQHQYLSDVIRETQASIVSFGRLATIMQARKTEGKVSLVEVLQTEKILNNEKANLSNLLTQRSENLHAINILLDLPPTREDLIDFPKSLTYQSFPDLVADIPMNVLDSRPDVKAARFRLANSFSNIDLTEINYYPQISLTGSLGSSSVQLLSLLSNPVAALGMGITLPFLNVTEKNYTIKIAQAQYQENVITFRKKLYTALKEVEDTQTSYRNEKIKFKTLKDNLDVATKIESLQEIRYQAGKIPLKDWLDAQEALRQSRKASLQSQYNAILAQNKAYQALGGLYEKK